MERLEWIHREQEGTTKYISLTEKGRALYGEIVPPQETFQAGQFQNLNIEEQHQLLQLLKNYSDKNFGINLDFEIIWGEGYV